VQSQKKLPKAFSFEFYPPKTAEGKEKLRAAWKQLGQLKPKYFSCTYGAGGSTREGTLETVLEIRAAGFEAAPHISCVASSRADLKAQIERYRGQGIRHIVALRGDLPSGLASLGELRYANELVAFIREITGDWFKIEVACYPEFHPETRSAADEIRHFKRKVDAGANAAITQYFYNTDAYFRFVDECDAAGITVPIVPGIMPIGNFAQLARFSDACGAEIPRWLRLRLEGFRDDTASIRSYGLDVVTRLCDDLLRSGAPGLHFYTLNQAGLTSTIWQRLGL
jgi:methylenetetrahydrofolate reductase (NADPH)